MLGFWGSAGVLVLFALASRLLLAAQAPQAQSGQYSPADVAAGARLYTELCSRCHGATGTGVGTIDLRRSTGRTASDTALRDVITNGIPDSGMPASRLDPNEARALVAFIRAGLDAGTNSAASVTGNAERGRALFEGRGNCLSCHRVNDRGQYAGPDLSDVGRTRSPAAIQRSLVDPTASMRPINRPVRAVTRDGKVIKGRRLNEDTYTVQLMSDEGTLVSLVKAELREWVVSTTSPMPSYKDRLTPEELNDLVAYLVSLKGSQP